VQIRRVLPASAQCSASSSTHGYAFRSDHNAAFSHTTGGMPFVKCYQGVNDGALYPLKEGLLFFKPPKFVPRSALHSIACGRGAGGSRYVDMVLSLKDATEEGKEGDNLEFSNIDRNELRVLNHYIHDVLVKAMEKDLHQGENEKTTSSTESDGSNNENEVGKRRKRSRRAASLEAINATKAQLQTAETSKACDSEEEDMDYCASSAADSDSDDDIDEDDEKFQKFIKESGQSDSDGDDSEGTYDEEDDGEDEETESESDNQDSDGPTKRRSKKARTT